MRKLYKYVLFAIPIIATLIFYIIILYQDSAAYVLNLIINSFVYNFGLPNKYYNYGSTIFNKTIIISIITIILEILSIVSILIIMNLFKRDIKEWLKDNKK